MNFLTLFSFFALISATQASQLSRRNTAAYTPPAMITCSPKGYKLDYSAQVMICRLEKAFTAPVIVTPSSSSLVFSKCSMTFDAKASEIEIVMTPKPGPCAADGTNEHEIDFAFESTDAEFKGKTDKQTVSTACTQSSACTVSGDPHFDPFTGNNFDFMGEGEYTIVDSDHGLRVTGSYYLCNRVNGDGAPITCMSGIAIQYGESVLLWNLRKVEGQFHRTSENMEPVKHLDGFSGKGLTYTNHGNRLEVIIDDGSVITVNNHNALLDVTIFLASRHHKKTRGQCNSWDNDMADQSRFLAADGAIESDINKFAESWRSKDNENPFMGNKADIKANIVADLKCIPEPEPPKEVYNPCAYSNGNCGVTTTTVVQTTEEIAAPTQPATPVNEYVAPTTIVVNEYVAPTTEIQTSEVAAPIQSTTIANNYVEDPTTTIHSSEVAAPTLVPTTSCASSEVAAPTLAPTTSCASSEVAAPTLAPTTSCASSEVAAPTLAPTTSCASTTAAPTTTAQAASPTTHQGTDKKCPSNIKDEATRICTQLIENVKGCEQLCKKFKASKIENCIKDAVNLCSLDFAEIHKSHYSSFCKTKTDFMINSSNATAKAMAQEIRQNNYFGEFADALDCGANGQKTASGCSCKQGFSGTKCEIKLEEILANMADGSNGYSNGYAKLGHHEKLSDDSGLPNIPGTEELSQASEKLIDKEEVKSTSFGFKTQISFMTILVGLVYFI